jgi:hypothetical protein
VRSGQKRNGDDSIAIVPAPALWYPRLELSERRGRPYGDEAWVLTTVSRLGLGHTLRREGRPSKAEQRKAEQ